MRGVSAGTGTLKDAVSETFREWTNRIDDTHYCLGSVMGPHPFPTIVRDFQAVISAEARRQILEATGRLPDAVLACVGGGSNAIGSFYHFIGDEGVRLIGCEAAGRGVDTWETAATIATGRLGIFHGMKSYFCQDEYGQIAPVYSISAGLDYPGVGPEHAWLHDTGRAEYVPVTDDEAVEAFEYLSRTEGVIPAIESAHAVAHAMRLAPTMAPEQVIIVTFSGRGDKDVAAIARYRGEDLHEIGAGINHPGRLCEEPNGKAFIPFITAGDPTLEVTEQLVWPWPRRAPTSSSWVCPSRIPRQRVRSSRRPTSARFRATSPPTTSSTWSSASVHTAATCRS